MVKSVNSQEIVCKSCGEIGHKTSKHSSCPNNPKNQTDKPKYDPVVAKKKLQKAEVVAEAVQDEPVVVSAETKLAQLQAQMKEQAEIMKQMKKEIEDAKEQTKLAEEEALVELKADWEIKNNEHAEQYKADYLQYATDLGINDPSNEVFIMYQSFKKFKPLDKSWEKKKRTGGGGGGGGTRKPKEKSKTDCQARLFYNFKGDWCRPDFCGAKCCEGSQFCKKHNDTSKRPDGIMDDGEKPELMAEDFFQMLITHEKYGEANRKQLGQ